MEFNNMMPSLETLVDGLFKVCKDTEDNILYTSEANLFMEPAEEVDAIRIFYNRRNLMFVTMAGVKDEMYCILCSYYAQNMETGELEEGPSQPLSTKYLDEAIHFFKANLKEAALSSQKAIFDMKMEEEDE